MKYVEIIVAMSFAIFTVGLIFQTTLEVADKINLEFYSRLLMIVGMLVVPLLGMVFWLISESRKEDIIEEYKKSKAKK